MATDSTLSSAFGGYKRRYLPIIVIGLLFTFLLINYEYLVGNTNIYITKDESTSHHQGIISLETSQTKKVLLQTKKVLTTSTTKEMRLNPTTTYPPLKTFSSYIPKPISSIVLTTPVSNVVERGDSLFNKLTIPHPIIKELSCAKLFAADAEEISAALGELSYTKGKYLTYDSLVTLIKSCDTFKEERQYILQPGSKEEEDFSIAYSIMMYQEPEMVERLLRAIYRPQNYYCIHVDAKAPYTLHSVMESLASCFDNVFVVPNPVEVYWGFYGVLEAELLCIQHLLQYAKWRYFINLTGEEFPLKTNLEIVRILKILDGDNDISSKPTLPFISRWLFPHKNGEEPDTNTLKPPPSFSVFIHKGDAHVMLSRQFVEYTQNSSMVSEFKEWLKDVFCPEELFFSTLQYNPNFHVPGGSPVINLSGNRTVVSRHKIWDTDGIHCHGKWIRNICIYGVGDLAALYADRHALFVNKLKKDFQPFTYDCLEELYFNRTMENYGLGSNGMKVVNVEENY